MEMGKLMALALSCGFPEPAAGWFLYFLTIPFMLAPRLLLRGATPVELALDMQPLLSWLRKRELCSSGELEGFGDCENKFLCSEVLPQVRISQEEERIPAGVSGKHQGSALVPFQLEWGITSTCCLASSAHRAQEGVHDVLG